MGLPHQVLEEVSEADMAVFKKKIKMLEAIKGRHTELITQYIPPGTDRSTVMNQLSEEVNQSGNIKSPSTRKNVQGALRKIIGFLKNINFKLPTNGIVVFAGNTSENEGRSDIRLYTVTPVRPLKVKMYWCDSEFHLDHLKEMMAPNDFYAIMTIDKNESTIAQLVGKKYEILGHFTSMVPGKTRAGGQCLSPDTQIILENGEIKEIKDIQEGDKIKSVDLNNGQTLDTKVLKKWKTKKQKITIKTGSPQFTINCSKDHTLFVYENNKIIEKPAAELKQKDTLLFSELIPTKPETTNLSANNYNSFTLTSNGQKMLLLERKKQNLYQKELAKQAHLTQTEISILELGKRNPRNNTIKEVCKVLNIDYKEFIKKYCNPKDAQTLPTELSPELAEFLGYFNGDGSFEKERIAIYDADEQIVSHYSNKAKQLFTANVSITHREKKGHYQTRIYGKQIVNFIKENFPEINKAKTSSIPNKILAANNEILASFLRGFFDAEGYAGSRGIGLGINNQKLAQQIQLCLLRFGIISSLAVYDNRRNPYSKNPRYTIGICGQYSLILFKKIINFNSTKKQEKLEKKIKQSETRDKSRKILADGRLIKEMLSAEGNKLKPFYESNMFLNGKRNISKEVFKKQLIEKANSNAQIKLNKLYNYNILPTEIIQIKENQQTEMVDLEVENKNFIANGIIVHNSSVRFERLREEAMQDFFKKSAEKFNAYFEPYIPRIKGVLIGGPGMTKNYFIEKKVIHHELEKKILGIVDTAYTDEGGIRELVQKSQDLLKDSELVKERQILDKFLGEVAKDGLATYGQAEVEKALDERRVSALIISEDIPWTVFKKYCEHCENSEIELVKEIENFRESDMRCTKCNSRVETTEEVSYLDYMIDKAKETGAQVRIISTETNEGKHFYEGFGGLAALLRYKA